MRFRMDYRGQIYTAEGVAAAIILLGVLMFIIQASSITTPQTAKTSDMKLFQLSSDAIASVDRLDEYGSSMLQFYVARWNGTEATQANVIPPTEAYTAALDSELRMRLPTGVNYNVEIYYGEPAVAKTVILHGEPGDNSVVSARLVSINNYEESSGFWKGYGSLPRVVMVRLITWYV